MQWSSSSGRIVLNITRVQAQKGHHSGACDDDIEELLAVPAIARQIKKLDNATMAGELKEYGAWSEEELQDHKANESRILWLACGDLTEEMED